jgi:ABC-2 type transport system permease protein
MFIPMVLFGFARVVFDVRIQGSMAGFLSVCAAFSLMTASWGLLIAALGKAPGFPLSYSRRGFES